MFKVTRLCVAGISNKKTLKMKNIKFKKINQNQHYFYFLPLSILGVFMFFFNPLNLGIRENKIYGLIPILIAFLIMNYFFLPINIVEYNSKFIRIKINSSIAKNINIEELKSVNFNEDELQIVMNDNKNLKFDLKNIDSQSKIRLEQILNKI